MEGNTKLELLSEALPIRIWMRKASQNGFGPFTRLVGKVFFSLLACENEKRVEELS